MKKNVSKSVKPKDRLNEFKKELIHHMGFFHDGTKHHISLVAEQVAHNTEQIDKLNQKVTHNTEQIDKLNQKVTHNTEQIDKLNELVELIRYDLKLKVDNLEFVTLSRRVAILEKKLDGKTR
jgi:predicted RNase H-like nuclease (RuvC/YqgF family)